MTNFLAVTETGTTYRMQGGILLYESKRIGTFTFRPYRMAAFDRMAVKAETQNEFWEYVATLPEVKLPVVGLSFFAAGLSQWRLSTPVVSVEELESVDD
jgi:hypothetical protein